MKNTSLSCLSPTPANPSTQGTIEAIRTVSIALPDILFELGEFKARHDHDLHELKAIVRRREAESGRLADALHLLRDLQATLSMPLPPVAAGVASSNGHGVSLDDPREVTATRGAP